MQSQYHLRPVADLAHAHPPPAAPLRDLSPHLPPLQYNPAAGPPRRPISPSQLPHLDVAAAGPAAPRIFPPPPSGHELMRLFPPPPPDRYSDALKPGTTSIYFHRQEHAFFAQAGKEIVRMRVESDFAPAPAPPPPPPQQQPAAAKGKERQWRPASPPAYAHPAAPPVAPAPRDDERWRTPVPYAERRRAGKHTRRVVKALGGEA